MCRIVGAWDINKKQNQTLFNQMRDTLTHGGPDDKGTFIHENGLCLGHRRLSIQDLTSAGHQPYKWKNYTIVFNGEVYNFKEINTELTEYQFDSGSDTETIIKAWDKWGIECVKKFRGMFSFALWDEQKQKLYLVRDRLGVKPLFYQLKNDSLLFASELKALMLHPDLDKTISSKAVSLYLMQGYVSYPDSIFKNTYKLKPGSILEIDTKLNSKEYIYWDSISAYENEGDNDLPQDKGNYSEWKEIVRSTLIDSCKLRMVSDVPVGMFLSGGIDSSLVSAIAQKESNQQLKTFTIGFSAKEYNEAPFAKEVAQHIGTEHHEKIVSENDFEELLDMIPTLMDEPNGDASIIPTHIVSKFAREHVTVSLSADGGDEFFGGYTKYEISKNVYPKINKLPMFLRKNMGSLLNSLSSKDLDSLFSKLPGLKNYKNFNSKLLKFSNALQADGFVDFYNNSSSFLNQSEVKKLSGNYYDRIGRELPPMDPNRMISYMGMLDVNTYLEGDILTKVDRATMHTALEGREPLLDHILYEIAMHIPDEFKIQGNTTKLILRDILYEYVPQSLIDRPKQGFAIPLEKWLRGDLKKDILGISSDAEFVKTFRLNEKEVERHIKNFYDQNKTPQIVWYLYVLYKWYHKYMK